MGYGLDIFGMWWYHLSAKIEHHSNFCSKQDYHIRVHHKVMFIYHSRRPTTRYEHVSWNAPRAWCLAFWCPNQLSVVPLNVRAHSSIWIKIVIIKEWSKHRWSLRESFQHFASLGFSNSPFCQQAVDGVVPVLRIRYIGNPMQSDSWYGYDLLLVSIEPPVQFSLILQSDTANAKLWIGCNHANSDHGSI